jgi:hypothetical protein
MKERLGDTVMAIDGSTVRSFAICHFGPGTEAGSDRLFVKFGAVRPGVRAGAFGDLLDECEALASARGAGKLEVGVNLARTKAHKVMLGRGLRTEFQGVVMDRPNRPAYNRWNVYAVDDLR